jgi:4-hydroxy-2-oxoheptanedioate aldolase
MTKELNLERFKERMRAGELVLGMQHNSGSEAMIEVMAACGFDYVILDQEHGGYSMSDVERLVRASEGAGIACFVRILKNDHHLIQQTMDTGAQGVMVPHIVTRGDCESAVSAMRYMPAGTRGKSTACRAARWTTMSWDSYSRWANEETLLIPIIEDREAVEAIEDILSVPGLELVAVGPGDLSQSYGVPGAGFRSPEVAEALQRTVSFAQPLGLHVMTIPMPGMTTEMVDEVAAMGARVVWWGGDLPHFATFCKQLVDSVRSSGATARA